MLANYILSLVQIPSVQTNKQLMVKAEYDNNTNNTTTNNRCYFEKLRIKPKIPMYPSKEK